MVTLVPHVLDTTTGQRFTLDRHNATLRCWTGHTHRIVLYKAPDADDLLHSPPQQAVSMQAAARTLADPFLVQPATSNGGYPARAGGVFGMAGAGMQPQALAPTMPSLTELMASVQSQPITGIAAAATAAAPSAGDRRLSLNTESIQQVWLRWQSYHCCHVNVVNLSPCRSCTCQEFAMAFQH